jgi:hypothetical protein
VEQIVANSEVTNYCLRLNEVVNLAGVEPADGYSSLVDLPTFLAPHMDKLAFNIADHGAF